eukprot:gene19234-21162_t
MSAIKKFFAKKKMDVKFKQAGPGHTLKDDAGSTSRGPAAGKSTMHSSAPAPKRQLSQSASQAADAALARLEGSAKQPTRKTATSSSTWKNAPLATASNTVDIQSLKREVKGEMSIENRRSSSSSSASSRNNASSYSGSESAGGDEQVMIENSRHLNYVLFSCPMCPTCLPENEIKGHIEECLAREIEAEPGMIAASMIHTFNSRDKVKPCVHTLNKYLDNIIKDPSEEKYRKIKQSNKVFKERVAGLKGVKELLVLAIGFVDVKLPVPGNDSQQEEDFYVLSEGLAQDAEKLAIIKEYLNEAEPLKATLDRNVRVLEPASGSTTGYMPDEFYDISNVELKMEQMTRSESVEKGKQLMTKAMREAMARPSSAKRIYRFTLIRVRFPDGIMLEGTFYSKDKLSDVENFVKESLVLDWLPFDLLDASGKKLCQSDNSLQSLGLSPAAVVNFRWDPSLAADMQQTSGQSIDKFLTDELMARKMTL